MPRSSAPAKSPPQLVQARDDLHQGRITWPARQLVLVDIDGTLSNPRHRLRHVTKGGRKDWPAFFASCDQDPPVEAVVRWTRALFSTFTVALVSGRPMDLTGGKTLWWLAHHGVPYHFLFMRRGRDRRPDTEVKQEILNDILQTLPAERIAFAIDDRPSVIEQVWRKNNVRVFPVRASDQDQW